jgi:hypothetical protein
LTSAPNLTWNFTTIEASLSEIIELVVTVNANGTITNIANVTSDNDDNPNNDDDESPETEVPPTNGTFADLSIVKSVNATQHL